jgi:hypothetical protein
VNPYLRSFHLAAVSALLATSSAPAAAEPPAISSESQAIVGGREVSPGLLPALVSVEIEMGAARCSGALIAPHAVLTAGHCVAIPLFLKLLGQRALQLQAQGREATVQDALEILNTIQPAGDRNNLTIDVVVGANDASRGDKIPVTRYQIHPRNLEEYRRVIESFDALRRQVQSQSPGSSPTLSQIESLDIQFPYDFAVLYLDRRLSVTPLLVVDPSMTAALPRDGMLATAAGYGANNDAGDRIDGKLRALDVVITNSDCGGHPRCRAGIEFMVRSTAPGQSICKGDGGGPLLEETPQGSLVIGITSRFSRNATFDMAKPCTGTTDIIYGRPDAVTDWLQLMVVSEPSAPPNPGNGGCGCHSQAGGGVGGWLLLGGGIWTLARARRRRFVRK